MQMMSVGRPPSTPEYSAAEPRSQRSSGARCGNGADGAGTCRGMAGVGSKDEEAAPLPALPLQAPAEDAPPCRGERERSWRAGHSRGTGPPGPQASRYRLPPRGPSSHRGLRPGRCTRRRRLPAGL